MKELLKEKSSLKLPNNKKIKKFISYLLIRENWYKNLPLLKGGKFLVFLNPNINFKEREENYKRNFSNLDYVYTLDNEYYYFETKLYYKNKFTDFLGDDINSNEKFPQKIFKKFSFTLYPYCHEEFCEAIYFFEDDFKKIELEKKKTLQRNLLIKLYKLEKKKDSKWESLSKENQDLLISLDYYDLERDKLKELNEKIYEYIKIEEKRNCILEKLYNFEELKIKKKIKKIINYIKGNYDKYEKDFFR